MKKHLLVVSALFLGMLAGSVHAADLYVAQKDPAADDKGAGTEAKPFKTVQPAVEAAKPGDTIWVKAGLYQEPIRISKSGRAGFPITISAYKDDSVRMGFPPEALPADGKWQPIPGSKTFQLKLTRDLPDDGVLILDGRALLTRLKDTPPPDEKVLWATYRRSDKTLMFNANGKDPSSLGKLEYSRQGWELSMGGMDWWNLRHLEFCWMSCGPALFGNNCVIDECFFDHLYIKAIHLSGRANLVRRCTFNRCGCALASSGCGPGNTIVENLMVECGMKPDEDIRNDGTIAEPGASTTVFKGINLGQVFAYNVLADCTGDGWYADCPARNCRLIGNAFWNCGIYNEEAVNDSLFLGNYFLRGGLRSAACVRLNILDNFFDQANTEWHCVGEWPLRDSFMLLRGNGFYKPGVGYLGDFGRGYGRTSSTGFFRGSMVDYNRVWQTPKDVLINDGGAGKKYFTLDDIRNEFHWEHHGQATPLTDQTPEQIVREMGGSTVTFRVPWGKHSGQARPMLSAADTEFRWPAVTDGDSWPIYPQFFWHVADGNNDLDAFYEPHGAWETWSYFRQPSSTFGYGLGENHGCLWYSYAEPKFPEETGGMNIKLNTPATADDGPKMHDGSWLHCPTYSVGNHWLVMEGITPDKMLPQGTGYWSPRLATAPGAKITVSLRMRGKDLVSTDNGSPCVWLEFINATGQNKRRAFVVGKDDDGKMHNAELTKGTYDWKDVRETIIAPEGAIRMALFFGLRPCKGKVNFDDINIKTAGEADAGAATEILGPRLPLARFRETIPVDLSKVANRALADDADNDGKGGWTDQGPDADMREFPTGEQRFGGVLFKILPAPKSIVVLKSAMRPKGDMPAKVTIPIGRKFDVLFFLHAGAWLGGDEYFRYVIHYADGKDVTVSVGPTNLPDWIAEPVAKFPNEAGTFSTVARTVKVPQFGRGSVYRMEWSAPLDRRPVEIKSIEFVGNGSTLPVLLGVTGVMEW